MIEENEALAALKRMAHRDNRPQILSPAGTGPSCFAFVAHERERIANVRLPRPSLVVILEGAKDLVTMGRQLRFAAGTAIALPPGWQGDVVNDPDEKTGVYRALFLDFAESLVIATQRAHPEWRAARYIRKIDVPLDPLLTAAIHHAASVIAAASLPPPLLVQHRIMEILLILGLRGALPLRASATPSLAEAVRALVRLQPDHAWTAATLAAELGTSSATLRRKLARESHALRGIIAQERIAMAMVLLKQDGASLREAALASGYLSPRRFAERFRQVAGDDPRAIARTEPV